MVTYHIMAHNGVEVIDNTPEAENRFFMMDCLEERHQKEFDKHKKHSWLWRLACWCGIV